MELAEGRGLLVDSHDNQVTVHRSAHGAAVDVDVGLGVAAEDRAVAVGVNFDAAGVVRRELEQRIALPAHGEDHAVGLEILHGQGDLLAADRGVGEALVDVADVEQAIAAASQELDDALLHLRFHWHSSVYAERSEASPVRTGDRAKPSSRVSGMGRALGALATSIIAAPPMIPRSVRDELEMGMN